MRVRMGVAEQTVGNGKFVLVKRVEEPENKATLWIMTRDGEWRQFGETDDPRLFTTQRYIDAIDDPTTALFIERSAGLKLYSDSKTAGEDFA